MQGFIVGGLIGIVTGIITLFLIKTADSLDTKKANKILVFTGELASLPLFWFGGNFFATKVLSDLTQEPSFVANYIVGLFIVYILLIFYPILKWIKKMGERLGEEYG